MCEMIELDNERSAALLRNGLSEVGIHAVCSLPADVRWGSFVTHSFLPHRPCVLCTGEVNVFPQCFAIVSDKMAEFSFARRVFTAFLYDIFTGLES